MNYTQLQTVVHFAGQFHRRAAVLLGPVTEALSDTGLHQIVLTTDDARYGHTDFRLHPSVRVVRIPVAGHSIAHTWRVLAGELRSLLQQGPVYAVHLHGTLPCVVGSCVLAAERTDAHVLYSPAAGWLDRFRIPAAILRGLLRDQCALLETPPVATSPAEASALSRITGRAADLIEYPVPPAFFRAPHKPAHDPLIVTAGDAPHGRAVELFTRLAVLLYAEQLPVRFSWIGKVSGAARDRLTAAHVRVFETAGPDDTARYLSQAWIFVQTQSEDEGASSVAQSMAIGLPCLVSDTTAHRDIVRHGENGFICTSERDFVDRLTSLIANAAERAHIGHAARAEARRRFSKSHFRRRLLELYGFDETEVRTMQFMRAKG